MYNSFISPLFALIRPDDELFRSHDEPCSSRLAAPLLHFRTGATSPFRREVLRAFSDDGDYTRVSQLLGAPEEPLSTFQRNNFQYVLAVARGCGSAERWRARARDSASTADEGVVYEENRVFELVQARDLGTAKQRARHALEHFPTSHGLWVNLLVAMTQNAEDAAVEAALFELPRIVDIDGGLLGVYLRREPGLRRPVCNGG